MKNFNLSFLLLIFLFCLSLAYSCTPGKSSTTSTNDCINEKWEGFRPCTDEYLPVCGCDGKTYSNECAAYNAKLKTWSKGPCP